MPARHAPRSALHASRFLRYLYFAAALGIFLRLFRYSLAIPLNGDEAELGLNILNRTFAGLLHPLDYAQVAPAGYLLLQRASYLTLGMSEYAVRLLPTLAGIAAILLFARWASKLAGPIPAAIAVVILSVGNYSVFLAVEAKPYALDLFASILLLTCATEFTANRRSRWLILLVVAAPILVLCSFPAIFIAAAVGLFLLLHIRRMTRPQILLIILFGLTTPAVFVWMQLHTSAGQHVIAQQNYMSDYWKDAFPPHHLFAFFWWLLDVHAGLMFAYPFGGKNFASILSLILFLIGLATYHPMFPILPGNPLHPQNQSNEEIVPLNYMHPSPKIVLSFHDWIKIRAPFLFLFVTPFIFTLIASLLRRYPYGQHPRTGQHLAPIIILLIAVGITRLIDDLTQKPETRRIVFLAISAIFLIIAGATLFMNFQKKPDLIDHARARALGRMLFDASDTKIAVWSSRMDTPANVQWYLRQHNSQIIWNAAADLSWVNNSKVTHILGDHDWGNVRPTPPAAAIVTAQFQSQIKSRTSQRITEIPKFPQFMQPTGGIEQWDLFILPAPKSSN